MGVKQKKKKRTTDKELKKGVKGEFVVMEVIEMKLYWKMEFPKKKYTHLLGKEMKVNRIHPPVMFSGALYHPIH